MGDYLLMLEDERCSPAYPNQIAEATGIPVEDVTMLTRVESFMRTARGGSLDDLSPAHFNFTALVSYASLLEADGAEWAHLLPKIKEAEIVGEITLRGIPNLLTHRQRYPSTPKPPPRRNQ